MSGTEYEKLLSDSVFLLHFFSNFPSSFSCPLLLKIQNMFSLCKYIPPFPSPNIVVHFLLQKFSSFSSVSSFVREELIFPVPNIFLLFFSSYDQIFSKKAESAELSWSTLVLTIQNIIPGSVICVVKD